MKKIIFTALLGGITLLTSIPSQAAVTYGPWRLYSRDIFYVGYDLYTDCKYKRTVKDGVVNSYTEYAVRQVKGSNCPATP